MFLGQVLKWTSVADTDIPFTTKLNTNTKTTNNNGTVKLNKTGLYDVDASITVTGVIGDIIATVYADGVATETTATATITAVTDFVTLPIIDAVRVVSAQYPNAATISVRLNTAGLTVNGNMRVQYLQ